MSSPFPPFFLFSFSLSSEKIEISPSPPPCLLPSFFSFFFPFFSFQREEGRRVLRREVGPVHDLLSLFSPLLPCRERTSSRGSLPLFSLFLSQPKAQEFASDSPSSPFSSSLKKTLEGEGAPLFPSLLFFPPPFFFPLFPCRDRRNTKYYGVDLSFGLLVSFLFLPSSFPSSFLPLQKSIVLKMIGATSISALFLFPLYFPFFSPPSFWREKEVDGKECF